MAWIVYLHTNSINGKRYVGYTKMTMEERWWYHKRDARTGNRRHFAQAIRKHGPESFVHEILSDGLVTEQDAERMEAAYIDMLGTYPNEYNMTPGSGGGGGWKSIEWTNERRAWASNESKKRWNDPKIRQRNIEATTRGWNEPGVKERAAASQRRVNQDPIVVARKSAAQKRRYDLYRKTLPEKVCKGCQEPFKVSPSKQGRKFCLRECFERWHSSKKA